MLPSPAPAQRTVAIAAPAEVDLATEVEVHDPHPLLVRTVDLLGLHARLRLPQQRGS